MKSFHNGTIFTGESMVSNATVLVEDGTVTAVDTGASGVAEEGGIDLNGNFLAPAFLDLQIYGGQGMLFSQCLSEASLARTWKYCRDGGSSGFMITLATNTIEKFLVAIDVVKQYWANGGKGLLGLHLEGPYINPSKRGAHLEDCVHRPALAEVQLLLDRAQGAVKMMTLAPEQCEPEVVQLLLSNNVIVSAGHSAATYRQGMDAFDAGISAATHLFNAMSAFQHREPGLVGAIFDHKSVVSSLVADGIHVDYAAIRISKKILGPRLFLITDAVTNCTEGEYQHILNNDHYTLPNGILSGSALTMMKAVANCVRHAGIELEEALRMGSLYPARLIGADTTIGRISPGYKANFVEFNRQLEVVATHLA